MPVMELKLELLPLWSFWNSFRVQLLLLASWVVSLKAKGIYMLLASGVLWFMVVRLGLLKWKIYWNI